MYTSDPTGLGCVEPTQLGDLLQEAEDLLGGIFQSSDPDKDRVRVAKIDQAYQLAIAGNTTTLIDGKTGLQYLQYVAGSNEIAWGSDLAHAFAQQKLAQYQTYVATHGGSTGGIPLASSSLLPLIAAGGIVFLLASTGRKGRH